MSAPTSSLNPTAGAPLLEVGNVTAYYGDLQALFDISLQVNAGEIVSVVVEFVTIARSWPAPRPREIQAVIPRHWFACICNVPLPTVVAECKETAISGSNSIRQ